VSPEDDADQLSLKSPAIRSKLNSKLDVDEASNTPIKLNSKNSK
jgi:hypothetical protein